MTDEVTRYLDHVDAELARLYEHLGRTNETLLRAMTEMGEEPLLRATVKVIEQAERELFTFEESWKVYTDLLRTMGIGGNNDEEKGTEDKPAHDH